MKIGYLTQTLNRGTGGGRFAADIIDGVKASGHEVVVLKELEDGLEGQILGRGLKMITCVPEVIKSLKDCDVVHALDGYPFGVTAWLANIILKRKLFISALGTYAVAPLYRCSTSFLLKRAYKSAYKVIAISNFTKNEILKKVKLENIVVITPGIDSNQAEIIHNKQDEKFIISVGGIKERKGYHISIEAFGLIKDKFPDFKYIIVGDSDDAWQTILDKVIKKYNLEDRVIFVSDVSEKKLGELYNDASLFVLTPINTSDHHIEGFGLVYLEAARSGLPVIGTFGTGAEDAINNGKNGILVKQNDPENTADAMIRILSDGLLRENMSKGSLMWSREKTIDNEVKNILEIYEAK
jgi:phosphatidylinositol alpha-1,6-mannosyltransferase